MGNKIEDIIFLFVSSFITILSTLFFPLYLQLCPHHPVSLRSAMSSVIAWHWPGQSQAMTVANPSKGTSSNGGRTSANSGTGSTATSSRIQRLRLRAWQKAITTSSVSVLSMTLALVTQVKSLHRLNLPDPLQVGLKHI